jgi:hypothetical protein
MAALHNLTTQAATPLSSLPAPERAILFAATREDATVKPWHDDQGAFDFNLFVQGKEK